MENIEVYLPNFNKEDFILEYQCSLLLKPPVEQHMTKR